VLLSEGAESTTGSAAPDPGVDDALLSYRKSGDTAAQRGNLSDDFVSGRKREILFTPSDRRLLPISEVEVTVGYMEVAVTHATAVYLDEDL